MRALLLVLTLLSFFGASAQQNPVYSQYMHHGFPLNPALAGSTEALSVTAGLRQQWTGVEGAPTTQLLSGHTPLGKEALSVGMVIANQMFGVSRTTGVRGVFAYRIPLSKGKLSFGLSAGWLSGLDNWGQVVSTEVDPQFQQSTTRGTTALLGAGVYYYSQKAYAGISIPSLFEPEYVAGQGYASQFDVHNTPIYMMGGYHIECSSDFAIRPSTMLVLRGASKLHADLNALVQYRSLLQVGMSYRTTNTWVVLTKFWLNRQFSVAYAFDYWNLNASGVMGNAHELSLRYDLVFERNASNPRFF